MKSIFSMVLLTLLIVGCSEIDDGPKQNDDRTYALTDFDQLEMGNAFVVTVLQGSVFSVKAEGDRRNLDDLEIFTDGATLVARYTKNKNRQYTTYINITMPELKAVNFFGAVESTISGFEGAMLNVNLSGASSTDVDALFSEISIDISGASKLMLTGEGQKISGTLTGASVLNAFDYPVDNGDFGISGASTGKVNVSQHLKANVSGASVIVYRGNPQTSIQTSGASEARKD